MPTVTATALRTAAAKQRVETPYRYGYTVNAQTDHWDAVIVRRQLRAKEWRTFLADCMDQDGVTELHTSTIRLIERPSFRCRSFAVTVYAYADGSPYRYRRGAQFYTPSQFAKVFEDYHAISPSGEFMRLFPSA
jgi:hypothetical protein